MSSYDKYYQTKNLFGEANRELLSYLENVSKDLKVLDLGCGQGRNAIALAQLGFTVTGVDQSKVGIDQMQEFAQKENLELIGLVADIFQFKQYNYYDIVLLDSMFHFAKKDKDKEVGLIQNILSGMKTGALLLVCIQDSGKKVQILKESIKTIEGPEIIQDKKFIYRFEDQESGHTSQSDYRMIVAKK